MNTQRIFLVLAWAVCFVLSVDTGFTLLNQKNTALNIVGLFFLAGLLVISFKTKAFTKNPFNHNSK
ncbi:hypothetical protein GO755_25830 [Spirosoma sp. HMF4905]|uniref:Uncharacterized protein n=1 Tax=Spirosoma arboris TaxID=2682092 RepID=A0A7K1SI88_9BACT|nr:hypothetical protein [Spirosoma arboris]MVM33483.1 hypothetical protein [Spirosoma arboris]